jgi:hypothetical protein
VKYLNLLGLLLNSKIVLTEMAENEELITSLIKLLMSKNSFVALLASQVLKQTISHFSGNEYRSEQINKRIMIKGSANLGVGLNRASGPVNLLQESQMNQSQFMHNEVCEPMLFVQSLKEYFIYLDHIHET